MARKNKSLEKPKSPTCVCVTLHTYEAFVTADAWGASSHVCVICGTEHFLEVHPVNGDSSQD